MTTAWDKNFSDPNKLEKWLYGKVSLDGATRKWLLEEAKLWPAGSTLLDAGCGGGVTAFQLEAAGLLEKLKYTGVDFSQCMIDLAVKKVKHRNTAFVMMSIEDVGDSYESVFDLVLLRAVLAHVLDPEPILRSVIRALKPEGTLYIIFWNNPVRAKPIIQDIGGGFYDNAHSEQDLLEILNSLKMKTAIGLNIVERSATSDIRKVWISEK